MSSPQFRVAEESDAPVLLRFMREYYAFDGHSFDAAKASQALVNFLRDNSLGWAWLICDQETPVGYIVLTLGYSLEYLGRDSFIDEFFLLEPYRGRGWGGKALQFIEEFARSHDVKSIHLEVVQSNGNALEFYRKRGFVEHKHHLMTKWIGREFQKPEH